MSALEVCSSLIGLLFMEGHKGGSFDVSKVEISGESKVLFMEGCVGKSSKVFKVEQFSELEVALPEVLFMVGHKASSSKVAKVNGVLKVEVFVELVKKCVKTFVDLFKERPNGMRRWIITFFVMLILEKFFQAGTYPLYVLFFRIQHYYSILIPDFPFGRKID